MYRVDYRKNPSTDTEEWASLYIVGCGDNVCSLSIRENRHGIVDISHADVSESIYYWYDSDGDLKASFDRPPLNSYTMVYHDKECIYSAECTAHD